MRNYGEAAITRLCLTNFLTYEDVEYRPEPGLNMIIGPNGSGKSSLVCAICLALAGHTKVLGRAQHARDFIKYGCEFSELEIELFQKVGNITIYRKISANKSDWRINGVSCKQTDVESTVARLNIQVDNLCQFLPQDRVADFAKMSPQELLVATEHAVGSLTLIDNHAKLKDFQKKATELTSKIRSIQADRDKNLQLNEHLEAELQTFREYQKAKSQLNLYEAKVAWLVYDEKREAYLKLKERLKTCIMEYNHKKENYDRIGLKLKEVEARVSELIKRETAVELALRKISESRSSAQKEAAYCTDSIKDVQHQLKVQIDLDCERKDKLEQQNKALDDLKIKYEESARRITGDKVEENFESIKGKLLSINSQLNDLLSEREQLKTKLNYIEYDISDSEAQLHQNEQNDSQQMQILKRVKPQVYEVCMWLRKNQAVFKKPIHEPPVAVMHVKSEQAAGYLDGAIGADSLFCFIAEDPDDMESFVKLTREYGWKVNAAAAPRAGRDQYKSTVDASSVASLGVLGFISDLFEAPTAVFAYLCDSHHLHNIPYGTEKLEEGSYALHEKFRMSMFIAKDTWVTLIKSKYSSEITRCTRNVKAPKFLHAHRDTSLKSDLIMKLKQAKQEKHVVQTEYAEIKNKLEGLNNTATALKQEEKKLKQRLGEFNGLRDTLRVKKSQIEKLLQEPGNLENQMKRLQQKQREMIHSFSKCLNTLCHKIAETKKKLQQLALIVCQLEDSTREKLSIGSEYNQLELDVTTCEGERLRLEKDNRCARSEAIDCLQRAKTMVGFSDAGASAAIELPEEFKRKFEPLPNELAQLRAHILDEKNHLSLIMPQNVHVEEEYTSRKTLIQESQLILDGLLQDQQELMSAIEKLETPWKSELNELIAKVDRKFSQFFSRLGCEGHISVQTGLDDRQFDLYGIKIMVRFREKSELCELSPFQQSGGERSVSTILYMMALQELTVVPFRVVDEINQGMDSVNERRIFEFIVRTAEANNAQYFLITPKLLPGLPYSENMHVHIITPNSRFTHTNWDFDALLERRKAISVESS